MLVVLLVDLAVFVVKQLSVCLQVTLSLTPLQKWVGRGARYSACGSANKTTTSAPILYSLWMLQLMFSPGRAPAELIPGAWQPAKAEPGI